nr:cyclin, C-terminal domain-containing protein [Tanacetum cinerariifolium]
MSSIHDSIIEALVEPRHSPFPSFPLCTSPTAKIPYTGFLVLAHDIIFNQQQLHSLSITLTGSSPDLLLLCYNGRAYRLLSIVCLSLAAKMEESNIQSLVNLQVSEPRFIFESKIIQEMELSVMKKLNWRLL